MSTLEIISAAEEISQFLATSPTPESILAYQASDALQERLRYLLNKNREGGLTPEEHDELDEMEKMNHFIILLKGHVQENRC